MNPLEYFICGGFGGICTVLTGHPLDTIKVRLQTMPTPKAGEQPLYAGTLDCLMKTVRGEGVLGLYKGMGAPLVGIVPSFAVSFMGFALGRRLFGPPEGTPASHHHFFMAGALSGVLTAMVMGPAERLKCLLQTQPTRYTGPIDVARQLYREGGIASIYRGIWATLARDVPAGGAFFLAYEAFQKYATDEGRRPISPAGTVAGGACAGVAYWLVGMPADVVKSRMQAAPEGKYPKGARDVIRELVREGGPLAFYKGITPVILRAVPANAACFIGFEACKTFIDRARKKFFG